MKNDNFKDWLKRNLEEETEEIYFSERARDKVRRSINTQSKKSVHSGSWWTRKVSLPLTVVAFSLAALVILTGIYTRTFFYVSPQEIARFETQPQIILNNDYTPFGALQNQVTASLEQVKGVDRP